MTNTTLSSRTISPTALIDEVDVAAQAAAEIVERVVWGLDDRDKSVSTTAKGRLTKRSVPKVDVNVWLDQPGRGIPGVRSGADGHAIAPAWTDGQSVYVARSTFVAPPETVWEAQESAVQAGRRLPAAVSFLDLKALKGATYHELAHVLYSPRVGGYAATRLRDTERLRRAWNLLEDHRIETLFSSRYVGSIDYFTRIALNVVLRGNLDNEDATPDALLWLWGRKYLPFEIRTKVFDRFVAKFGEDLALRAVALIEEFLSTPHDVHTTQVAPRSAEKVAKVDRLVEVVTEFADILDFVQAQAITDGFPPIGDPGQGGHGAQAGGKAQAEADPIAPEQPPTTGGASAPGSGDDGADGADGADGSPANGDGASDGDAGADDADDAGATGGSSGGDGASTGDPADGPGHGSGGDDGLLDDLRDLLKEAEGRVERDARALKDAVADAIDDKVTLGNTDYSTTPVSADLAATSSKIRRSLLRLTNDLVARTERRTRTGRVNPVRFARTQNFETAFDRWHASTEGAASIDVVIAIDHSGSIGGYDRAISGAAWALKNAIDGSGVGKCSVLAFDHRSTWLYKPTDKAHPTQFRFVEANGATEPGPAIHEALRILRSSKAANRLFVVLTDGEYSDPLADLAIRAAKADGIETVGIFFAGAIDLADRTGRIAGWRQSIANGEWVADWAKRAVAEFDRVSRQVVTGGTDGSYVFGAEDIRLHGFALDFTVFSADGFASVVGKVVDNLRSEAATGRPDPWIAQQVKQRGVADAAKLTLVRCSHCGAANDAAKICCGECGLSLGL